jgi:hypothetical protein
MAKAVALFYLLAVVARPKQNGRAVFATLALRVIGANADDQRSRADCDKLRVPQQSFRTLASFIVSADNAKSPLPQGGGLFVVKLKVTV